MATDLAERAEVRRRALEAAVGGDVISTTPLYIPFAILRTK
jgi:hypothetical protein